MRTPHFLTALLVLLLSSCTATHSTPSIDNVLFVGNSLIYVGNVPAVFSELSAGNTRPVNSDMIVQGGATLAQRVADGSVARALEEKNYSALVLQERGGDLMRSFGPDSCIESRKAIQVLADLAKEKGITVVLLGTYQADPSASRSLVEGESSAAAEAKIPYVEVSENLRRLRIAAPKLDWLASDGMHPGKDLALLNAILLHRAVHGSLPEAQPLIVSAPIYGTTAGLKGELRQADAPAPLPETPSETRYPSETLETLLRALSDRSGS